MVLGINDTLRQVEYDGCSPELSGYSKHWILLYSSSICATKRCETPRDCSREADIVLMSLLANLAVSKCKMK